VPRKNVRIVAGLPLIAWTIRAAQAARRVTRVVVSTDDDEIAAVSKRFGADVVRRPAELSGDTASSESALLHVIEHLRTTENYAPELIAFLQCTSPLTLPEDIDGTIAALSEQSADSALSAARFFHFVWRTEPAQGAVGINHDKRVRPRRQDRQPEYLENGAVYAMRTEAFLAARHRFFGKTALYEVDAARALEIDGPDDFLAGELMLRRREDARRREALPRPIGAIVFDFDGVLTDNRVAVDQDGRESVTCDRSDGMGIAHLRDAGIPLLVLSKERNPVVAARCRKLQVDLVQGCDDKLPALRTWLADRRVGLEQTIYVGNDVNDAECLRAAACAVVPADAHADVTPLARIVLSRDGGRGAVRELADLILEGVNR